MITFDDKAFMNKTIVQLLDEINAERVSFLLGSGVSLNSGIPMVGGVHVDEIVWGIESYILSELGFSFSEISKFSNIIPFETFFEALIDNGLDMDGFARVFDSVPSGFHRAVALLAQKGFTKSIATTNFDQCMEKALDELGVDYDINVGNKKKKKETKRVLVRKFHGSLEDVQNFVISIKKITNKVDYDRRKSDIDDFINDSNCIIVCGYSCSDIFDITPIFNAYKDGQLKKIIYISHTNKAELQGLIGKNDPGFQKVYNMFGNYDLTILRCETLSFINALLEHYGILPVQNDWFKVDWRDIIDDCLGKFNSFQKWKLRGNLYFKIHENSKSNDCLSKACELSSCESDLIACLRSISWTLITEEKYVEARDILLSLLETNEDKKRDYNVHFANIFSQLGICYTNTDFDKAHYFYNQSLELCKEYGLKREEGYTLINIAELFDTVHNHKLSIFYTKEALRVLNKEGYIDACGICHSNLAIYYLRQKKYRLALGHIDRAIEISSKLGDVKLFTNRTIIKTEIEIRLFTQQKLGLIKRLKNNSGTNNMNAMNCNYLMGELHYISGQKKKALNYLKKTKKQADSLEGKSVFCDDIETLYEDCKLLIYRY